MYSRVYFVALILTAIMTDQIVEVTNLLHLATALGAAVCSSLQACQVGLPRPDIDEQRQMVQTATLLFLRRNRRFSDVSVVNWFAAWIYEHGCNRTSL